MKLYDNNLKWVYLNRYSLHVDSNECESENRKCSQLCVNKPGSFHCQCEVGYRMEFDDKTCSGEINSSI